MVAQLNVVSVYGSDALPHAYILRRTEFFFFFFLMFCIILISLSLHPLNTEFVCWSQFCGD